jgi:predicted AlkP superfamily phosphohydrolase/phosphomutase
MSDVAPRVLVIGLDCAPPQLVFGEWSDHLPVLRGLMDRGCWGTLESSYPCITVPAWSCMTASVDAGELGIYGFRNRRDHSYDGHALADSRAVTAPRVWDVLSARGRPVIALGVPGTYPPTPVNGVMVSCFLTPDPRRCEFTYPPEMRHEIEAIVGEYMVDVEGFRTSDKGRLLTDIETMTDRRFQLAEHLAASRPWDLFFLVEMGTDRIQHGFWRFMDPEHRLHQPGTPHAGAILAYYRRLDERIGRLLDLAGEETAVVVASDHGAKRMDGGICLNEWLRQEGYLTLLTEPVEPTALRPELVDWSRTVAWGDGGYYGRVFLNVRGREPEGIVDPDAYEGVRTELKRRLEALGDEQGRAIGTVAHRPEELYRRCRGVPPDLLVYFGDLHWRSIGKVGTGAIHLFENDTGPDDANHAQEGLYLVVGAGVTAGRGPMRDIRDIAPTILHLLGEPVPASMQGRSILKHDALASRGHV